MTRRRILGAALVACAVSAGAQEDARKPADAAPARAIDTLQRIRETGAMPIGVRAAAFPFSFVDNGKHARGYSVDLCLKIADAIKSELGLPRLEVRYIAVPAVGGVPALVDGTIDLECGATANTRERQQQVAFAYTTFVTGIKLLARKNARIAGLDDLRGKTIVVPRDTSGEKLMTAINEQRALKMNIVVAADPEQALRAVEQGTAVALATDDVLLSRLSAKAQRPEDFAVVGKYLSIEPYAIMLRKGEPRFEALVDRTLASLFASGEIRELYAKWFAAGELRLPMNPLLNEAFTAPNTYPAWP